MHLHVASFKDAKQQNSFDTFCSLNGFHTFIIFAVLKLRFVMWKLAIIMQECVESFDW